MDRLVVAVDTDESADDLIDAALPIARGLGAEIVVLHVLEMPENLDEDVLRNPGAHPTTAARLRAQEAAVAPALRAHAARFRDAGLEVRVEIARGEVAAAVVDVADDLGATLIAIATHGHRGLTRLVIGSVAEEVLRTSHVPVFAVRIGERPATAEVFHHPLEAEAR